jgi:hypothetical protein
MDGWWAFDHLGSTGAWLDPGRAVKLVEADAEISVKISLSLGVWNGHT